MHPYFMDRAGAAVDEGRFPFVIDRHGREPSQSDTSCEWVLNRTYTRQRAQIDMLPHIPLVHSTCPHSGREYS